MFLTRIADLVVCVLIKYIYIYIYKYKRGKWRYKKDKIDKKYFISIIYIEQWMQCPKFIVDWQSHLFFVGFSTFQRSSVFQNLLFSLIIHFTAKCRCEHRQKSQVRESSTRWLLRFYDSTRDKDDTTVGVGHSRRYCNTGYDQSQGRRPSTLKCIGPISKGDIEPNHPSEINPNSDSRSRSDGRSRRFVQYRVDQSQGQRPRSLLFPQSSTRIRYILLISN